MEKKDPHKPSQNPGNSLRDYFYTMLSILSQKDNKAGPCPDPEELAAFSEGRLRGQKRKAVMDHLSDCSLCRRQWLLVASMSEDMPLQEDAWIDKLARKIKNLRRGRLFIGGGVGLSLAACLLWFILIPHQSELSKMIAHSYGALSPADVARYNSFASRGAEENANAPASGALLAYRAGIQAGNAYLQDKTESLQDKDEEKNLPALLYSIGQWVVLLECQCGAPGPPPEAFWSQQEEIARKLQDKLKGSAPSVVEAQYLLRTVTTLRNHILQIQSTGGQADGCEDIATTIENLENRLRSNPASGN